MRRSGAQTVAHDRDRYIPIGTKQELRRGSQTKRAARFLLSLATPPRDRVAGWQPRDCPVFRLPRVNKLLLLTTSVRAACWPLSGARGPASDCSTQKCPAGDCGGKWSFACRFPASGGILRSFFGGGQQPPSCPDGRSAVRAIRLSMVAAPDSATRDKGGSRRWRALRAGLSLA
jgi:hypothetical protein